MVKVGQWLELSDSLVFSLLKKFNISLQELARNSIDFSDKSSIIPLT
jgi:hypothetical protein